MKKTGKKVLLIALAVVLAAGLAGGAYLFSKSAGGETVNVYPVSQLAETDYWGDSTESYGTVTTDRTQSIYLSSTQTVSEVYVKEGQTVKKGDVLMAYDTTLSEVEVERKDLEIQKMEMDLKTAKSNLEKVKKYRPGVPVSEKNQINTELGDYGIDDDDSGDNDTARTGGSNTQVALAATGWQKLSAVLSAAVAQNAADSLEEITSDKTAGSDSTTEAAAGEASEETKDTQKEESTEKETTQEETIQEETTQKETTQKETTASQGESTSAETTSSTPEGYPEFTGGSGKKNDPYVYKWNGSADFDQELMEYLAKGKKKAFVKLQVTAGSGEEETEEAYWIIYLKKKDGTYILEMREIGTAGQVIDLTGETKEETTEEETADDPGIDDPVNPVDEGVTYTAAEIAELRSEVEENIRDLDLEIRTAEVEYRKLKMELDNGSVVCEVDGTVTTIRDEEEAKVNNQAFIDISGGGGYYVEGSVSELDLGDVVLGQTVTVMSQESGLSYEGEITEISEYPTTDTYSYSSGNTNTSYYPFKVFIDESASLQDGEFVSLSYQAAGNSGDSLYLVNSMIRTENGTSYVYVKGEDGKLKRQDVKTGKTIWSTYVEIQSGLSEGDYIAFPYGKSVKEGAATREADIDELYNY